MIKGGSIRMAKTLTDNYLREGGLLKTDSPVKRILIGGREKINVREMIIGVERAERTDPVASGEASKVYASSSMAVSGENTLSATSPVPAGENVPPATSLTPAGIACGIELESGEIVEADYVICACDINYTFTHLLDKKYAPLTLKRIYDDKKSYPLYSAFQVAFAVDGLFEEVPDSLSFECNPIEAAFMRYERIGVKNYREYGDYIAPEGKTVIQVMLDQYPRDCDYWRKLCEKGLLKNENGVVTSRISREEFYSAKSEQIIEDSYRGSLPAFVASFISRKELSAEEAEEIRKMIDAFRREG